MNLSNDVKNLALEENLDGHMKAVEIREKFLTKEEKLRTAFKFRKTNETKIYTSVNIDGTGNYSINTGIKFYDHMLEQFAKHGEFDFVIEHLVILTLINIILLRMLLLLWLIVSKRL